MFGFTDILQPRIISKVNWATVSLFLFSSCSFGTNEPQAITVDIAQSELKTINPNSLIQLENSAAGVLYDISQLEVVNGNFFIQSRNYLKIYDSTTGKFLGKLECDGLQNPKSVVANMWQQDGNIFVHDSNLDSIYQFNNNGEFISSVIPYSSSDFPPGVKPRKIIPADKGFYTINFWTGGTSDTNPALAFYSEDGALQRPIEGRDLREGTFTMDGAFFDKNSAKLLYWEPMRDTLFIADKETVRPLYAIDFGSNSIPPKARNMPLYRKNEIFQVQRPMPYVSFAMYYQPYGTQLWFTVASSDGRSFLCSYDSEQKTSTIRHFASNDGIFRQGSFFKIESDSIYLSFNNTAEVEANPLILKLNIEEVL